MSEPTPRQVLYGLVAGGFLGVVAVLVIGAAVAGLVPGWWTAAAGASVAVAGVWSALNWRRTGAILGLSIGLFALWVAVALVVA